MLAADIPTQFPVPFANAPDPGTSRVVPLNPTGQPGAAALTTGFPAITMESVGVGGVPPFGQDFNGLLNQITAWSRWVAAGAPIIFDATFQTAISGYPAGAVVMSATTLGRSWLSLVDSNATDPDAGGAGWRPWVDVTQINSIAGNPNGVLAGNAATPPYISPALAWDTTHGILWVCTTTGNAAGAVWTANGSSATPPFWCGTSAGSANTQTLTAPGALQAFPTGTAISFDAGFTNTGALTVAVGSFGPYPVLRDSPTGPVALTGGEVFVGNIINARFDGASLHLGSTALGTAAQADMTAATGKAVAARGAFTAGHVLVADDVAGTAKDGGPLGSANRIFVNSTVTIGTGFYDFDTSGGSFPINLAPTPALGDSATLSDFGQSWGPHPLTINGNGHNIGTTAANAVSTFIADVTDCEFSLFYTGTFWRLT